MNVASIQALITSSLSTFGVSVLVIITAVIAVGVAYFIFKFGWSRVKTALGTSEIGSFYAPKGKGKPYNRGSIID